MNTQTTHFSAHDLPVPAVHEAGSPRLGYSAFRLDALALNADLATLGTAGPASTTDQGHWIMETEHLSAMVLSVAGEMRKLAQLRGLPVPETEQLAAEAIAALGYALTPRPASTLAHLRFLLGLTVRCLARSTALQAEISTAYRRGIQAA